MFLNANTQILDEFCPLAKTDLINIANIAGYFYLCIMISGIGYITSIVQKLTVVKLNDNAELQMQEFLIHAAIAVTSTMLVLLKASAPTNSLISDFC